MNPKDIVHRFEIRNDVQLWQCVEEIPNGLRWRCVIADVSFLLVGPNTTAEPRLRLMAWEMETARRVLIQTERKFSEATKANGYSDGDWKSAVFDGHLVRRDDVLSAINQLTAALAVPIFPEVVAPAETRREAIDLGNRMALEDELMDAAETRQPPAGEIK